MAALNENNKPEKKWDFPYMSKHFVKRYFERVLSKPVPKKLHKGIYNNIKKDMEARMMDREKLILKLFANTSKVVVPIARFNQMVVKKNTLITVY